MANKIITSIKTLFQPVTRPAGNVIDPNLVNSIGLRRILDQQSVKEKEPFGTKKPQHILQRSSGWSQMANLSHQFTLEKIQASFRQAETGDTRLLFAYYRDFFLGNGMIVSELGKRKLSTLSEQYSIIPASKDPQDVKASEIIKEALDHCPSLMDGLVHLMNAIVFPLAALEKTFEPIDSDYGDNPNNLRYKIKKLYPVDYNLINYRLPYLPQGPINFGIGNQPIGPVPPVSPGFTDRPEDTIFDPDSWEPDLRFWSVFNNGLINFSYANMMEPDPNRHIIYRCNLLTGIARENWGGMGRSVLWWAIMAQLGVDVFLRCLQKWGLPFIIAKVDTSQVDTVATVMSAFENINIINSMVINKDATTEIAEMNYSGAADAHSKFIELCHNQISLLINGQTLSSNAKSTGLGSGVANLQSDVRQDIIKFDRLCLNETLKNQLFKQYLEINMIKGKVPSIVWGGGNTPEENKDLSITILNLYNAGIQVTDESLEELSEKTGLILERSLQPITKPGTGGENQEEEENKEPKEKKGKIIPKKDK